jgi:hypothetical protein
MNMFAEDEHAAQRLAYFLFLITSFAVLVPALALVFFAEPVADDFERAISVDVPHAVAWAYSHRTGRWAEVGLDVFLLSKMPMLSVYSGILLGLQVVHFLALLAFWQMLVGSAISLRGRLGLALGSLAFLLAGYPYPEETVYWVPGGVQYQLPVSLALLFLATVSFTTGVPLRPSRALPRALALGIFGFAITGFQELVALALLGVLIIGTIFVLVERRPNPGIWLILLGFVALGTAINVLAPGNAERGATDFPHGRSFSYGIIALARLLMRVLRWIDLKLVAASVLFALTFGPQLRPSKQDPRDRARIWTWAVPFVGASILLGSCAALTYATGYVGPGRSHNLLYTEFCIAWFASLVTVLKIAPDLSSWPVNSSIRAWRNVATAFFCVSLIGSMNPGVATRDLLVHAVPWRRAMAQRYDLVRQAAKLNGAAADVVVPPVVPPDMFWRDLDIRPDADFPINRFFAKYFGVRSVRVGESPVQNTGTVDPRGPKVK